MQLYVYTWALSSDMGAPLGPKYILHSYMEPLGISSYSFELAWHITGGLAGGSVVAAGPRKP